jgi:hypothetical protein
MFPLSALMFVCRFIVLHPCFIACLKAELTYLHSDCMSLIEHNGYPMTCLDLSHYVVCMSARVQSNILPEFYIQIALNFLILLVIETRLCFTSLLSLGC